MIDEKNADTRFQVSSDFITIGFRLLGVSYFSIPIFRTEHISLSRSGLYASQLNKVCCAWSSLPWSQWEQICESTFLSFSHRYSLKGPCLLFIRVGWKFLQPCFLFIRSLEYVLVRTSILHVCSGRFLSKKSLTFRLTHKNYHSVHASFFAFKYHFQLFSN